VHHRGVLEIGTALTNVYSLMCRPASQLYGD